MSDEVQFPIVIDLKYPIEFGDKMIDKLEINRRPKTKDLKGFSLKDLKTDYLMIIAARLTNQPPKVIEELDFADAKKIYEVVSPFLDDFLST